THSQDTSLHQKSLQFVGYQGIGKEPRCIKSDCDLWVTKALARNLAASKATAICGLPRHWQGTSLHQEPIRFVGYKCIGKEPRCIKSHSYFWVTKALARNFAASKASPICWLPRHWQGTSLHQEPLLFLGYQRIGKEPRRVKSHSNLLVTKALARNLAAS